MHFARTIAFTNAINTKQSWNLERKFEKKSIKSYQIDMPFAGEMSKFYSLFMIIDLNEMAVHMYLTGYFQSSQQQQQQSSCFFSNPATSIAIKQRRSSPVGFLYFDQICLHVFLWKFLMWNRTLEHHVLIINGISFMRHSPAIKAEELKGEPHEVRKGESDTWTGRRITVCATGFRSSLLTAAHVYKRCIWMPYHHH